MNKIVMVITLLLLTTNVVAQSDFTKPRGVPIEEIIAAYSDTSGEKVLVDPRIKARVKLFGQALQELSYDNLTTILNVHNFGSFRSGGFLVIVPLNIIKQEPIELVEEGQTYVSNETVSDLIKLDKLCPYDLVSLLRPITPPTSHFAMLHAPRTLFVTATYANTKRIRQIIERLESQLDKKQACLGPAKTKGKSD